MFTQRVNGTDAVNRLRHEMDRVFENVVGLVPGAGAVLGGRTFPALNVWEDEHNLYAEAELPGVSIQDVELLVTGNELTLRGEIKPPPGEGAAFHRRERGAGPFSRTVRLPVAVDSSKVSAQMRDGVMTVTLPKPESVKPRKIEVKLAGQ